MWTRTWPLVSARETPCTMATGNWKTSRSLMLSAKPCLPRSPLFRRTVCHHKAVPLGGQLCIPDTCPGGQDVTTLSQPPSRAS